MVAPVEALVKRNLFASEEEAIGELVRDYVLRQVDALQTELQHLQQKYGMDFSQFQQYLHERSVMLTEKSLPAQQLEALHAAVMLEEEDWLDWKTARDLLENWLGLREEIGG